jgi:quinol-cytochrome oxidoreductase complex cytochrome b subunit
LATNVNRRSVDLSAMWGFLIFLIGIAYGWLSPGKEDKSTLFKKGALWGIVAAIAIAIIGFVTGYNPIGLADNGIVGNIIAAVVLALAFIIGVWIGDMLPGGKRVGPNTGVRRV